VQRVNKDDMRGKGEVDDVAGAAARAGKTVIVDNCNLTKCHRKAWVEWASGRSIWCVFFARDVGDCRERIVRRVGHPTLPTAAAGLRALGSLEGVLEPPAAAEGFEKLEVVLSDDGSNALAEEWGGVPVVEAETPSMDTGLMKFPRTPHLVNLGAATRDDKVLSPGEVALLLSSGKQVIVQEKVDGANLGLSISPEGKIRVQNRGHFVDASYHDQFKPLDKWVSRHTEELWELLGGDEPGRWILYGEWLHAKHSVAYSRLPDLFLAFDLYDRLRGEFVDHETLKARLAPTSIHIVPVLSDSPLRSVDDLLAMVRGPSAFSDGLREGVYVRICDGGRVVLRAKLVRPDFIAGNERWNKSKIEPNVVSPAAHA
jgi:atypical dual specificity phosphatase